MATMGEIKARAAIDALSDEHIMRQTIVDLEMRLFKANKIIEFLQKERDEFEDLSRKQGAQLEALALKVVDEASPASAKKVGNLDWNELTKAK